MDAHPVPARPPKLLDQVAAKMRLLHYSKRTEEAYVNWIKRFILFPASGTHAGCHWRLVHQCNVGAADDVDSVVTV